MSNRKEEEMRLSEYSGDKSWILKEAFLFVLVNTECLRMQHALLDSDIYGMDSARL